MAGKLERQLKKRKGFDSVQQAVVVATLRTNDELQFRFGQLFRDYDLTQAQYNVLRILRGEGKPLPVLEIRSRLVARTAAITGLLNKLEKRGLVAREHCADDRRVWFVKLTAAGKKLTDSMDEPVMALHRELCGGLTAAECRTLVELLEKAWSHHQQEVA
ncbi:MAG: MarR family transcriptional regulator [Pirellulales bacterium]|nr:MarR family transcriptional regulator [Pirellulales bacterium]